MDYIFGSLQILRNKLHNIKLFNRTETPRINPILPFYKQYYSFFSESSKIIDNLYLGSSFNAYSLTELNDKKVNVIINITDDIDNFFADDSNFTYYKFPIKDNNEDDITDILNHTFNIIKYHLNKGDCILVHCFMGASRSASVIIHYLMKTNNISYDRALQYVIEKRNVVNLSELFELTLRKLE